MAVLVRFKLGLDPFEGVKMCEVFACCVGILGLVYYTGYVKILPVSLNLQVCGVP